jgi:hypothetical protein
MKTTIRLLLISLFLWGLSCQNKQDETPTVPEIPETSEVVETPPEEPEIPVTPSDEPTIPEEPVTGDQIYEKIGYVVYISRYFWSYAECTGYEIWINSEHYKPDSLPDKFKWRDHRVKVTYRISDKKYVCGTGAHGSSQNREIPIINIITIEKFGEEPDIPVTPPAEPGEEPGLKGTTWRLSGYFSPKGDTLQIFEPQNCLKCYSFTFDTDTTASGYVTANYLSVNLNRKRPVWVPTMAIDYEDGPIFNDILLEVVSFTYLIDELKFVCYDNNYLLFKKIKL